MEHFIKLGYRLILVDLSPILHPYSYKEITTGLLQTPDAVIKTFRYKKDYKDFMSDIEDTTVFLLCLGFSYETSFIFRSLKKHRYGFLYRTDFTPDVWSVEDLKSRITKYIRGLSPRRILQTVYHRVPRWIIPYKKAEFAVHGGSSDEENIIRAELLSKSTKITYIHAFDFDQYLKVNKTDIKLVESRYCVFIDQYIPFHPDRLEDNLHIESNIYYEELSHFLSEIQRKLQIKVVIAAHPRSDYEKHPEYFSQFGIYRFKTCELVRYSEFVFGHWSTALSFGLLYYKPIFLLSCSSFHRNDRKILEYFRDLLHAPVLNTFGDSLEENLQIIQNTSVDEILYRKLIRKYLKGNYEPGIEYRLFAEELAAVIEIDK